ncbi:uncharacterized protein KQ657_002867 [Scheffersomyces spartinae]|uniref:Mmc1 C-terminal domain-containing protein n=1 Tax=Scheffersomyces spartinae TaxID=45513 RepID=A0A9P7V5W7_9ASCO|nr:uncharacterized protein KQ657_002867 [Scheffersomyces spartinae]KAG7191731.1 hypothetical protein KQ657_002867 [Scheffersomyces spartinae]
MISRVSSTRTWVARVSRTIRWNSTKPLGSSTIREYMKLYQNHFSKDVITNKQIDSYLALEKNPAGPIKVGILYDDTQALENSKIIECLLADPLSDNNSRILEQICQRSKHGVINTFTFDNGEVEHNTSNENDVYRVPSPILSANYRSPYMKNNIVDIELLEIINTLQIPQCDFYINVTSDLPRTLTDYSKKSQLQSLITIVDNEEFTPTSNPETPFSLTNEDPIIKVNTKLSLDGINLFSEMQAKAALEFLNAMQSSNIYELFKVIGHFLRPEHLLLFLRKSIENNIAYYNVLQLEIDHIYSEIKSVDITSFSGSMHSELQAEFIPNTTKFFRTSLSWWKLYLKNDNVEYCLKDYFAQSFMPKSIENYNFLRGQIVSKLETQKYGDYNDLHPSIHNPLMVMKNQLVNQRIESEIQPVVFKTLLRGLTYYQLPISVIAFLGYQYFGISGNASLALGLLGWTLGFNQVASTWEKFSSKWLQNLYEDIRMCLGKECIENGLYKELATKYNQEIELYNLKQEILKGIHVHK